MPRSPVVFARLRTAVGEARARAGARAALAAPAPEPSVKVTVTPASGAPAVESTRTASRRRLASSTVASMRADPRRAIVAVFAARLSSVNTAGSLTRAVVAVAVKGPTVRWR